jgi:hypothetical protein
MNGVNSADLVTGPGNRGFGPFLRTLRFVMPYTDQNPDSPAR